MYLKTNNKNINITEKFRIRLIKLSDTKDVLIWMSDPIVNKYYLFGKQIDKKTHEDWVRTSKRNKTALQYIIEDRNNDMPIGSILIKHIDPKTKKGELGVYIGNEKYRGKGYGTKIIDAFVEYCFSILGFDSIYLKVIKTNKSAIKAYRNVGFKKINADELHLNDMVVMVINK